MLSSMAAGLRVLVVTSEPDHRSCTTSLRVLVEELRQRPGVSVDVWFLRPGPDATRWGPHRCIDDLRTWPVPRLLERAGLAGAAARLRGLQLRRWYRQAAPDVVLLDDGVGGRVLPGGRSPRLVVVRENADLPPESAGGEERWSGPVDVALCGPGSSLVSVARSVVPNPHLVRLAEADRPREAGAPAGGDPASPLIVGWGGDGWVDGSDLFIRALWHLEHRHGLRARGLWLQQGGVDEHVDRLVAESTRCGVAERYQIQVDAPESWRWCGDLVVLPGRSAAPVQDLLDAMAHDQQVVTFAPVALVDGAVRSAPPLDLDALAGSAVEALAGRPPLDPADQASWQSVVTWTDHFLSVLEGRR